MAKHSQPPEKSILLTRPTNGFYGVYSALREGNPFLLLVALMTILSEFLPILLANVPYNLTQSELTHVICARMTISILGLMIITVAISAFIKWPHMPVDPRSIAGAMYYVSEAHMLADFEGMSRMNSKDREKRIREIGTRYFYGDVMSSTGGRRMGVDGEGGLGMNATPYVGYQMNGTNNL
jgi:fluoride exporter